MKKVCISTFCVWSSYGSIFQAYGLQYALRQIDCEGFIAIPNPAPKERWTFPGIVSANPKAMVVAAHKLLIHQKIQRRYTLANDYIHRNIQIEYFESYEALRKEPPKADAYITGSDQVWNPRKLDPAFFLEYIPREYPRISYAASMGVTEVPPDKQADFKRMVASFDYISLREEDNLPVVSRYTDRVVQVNIDPVFLVPSEDWVKMEVPYPIREPYILIYPIYWDKKLNKEVETLQKQTKKTVVAILGQAMQVYANKRIYDASPEQFLWLIDHADAVISSSFHGIALSVIFQKKFAAIIDPKSPSRITCLLDKLGVQNSSIHDLMKERGQGCGVLESIEFERTKGMNYLRKVLYSG